MIDMELLNRLYASKRQELSDVLDKLPHPVKPIVTQADAKNGYLTRYFVKQVNDDNYIVEVDLKQYERFKQNFKFTTTKVQWKIVGKKETLKMNTGINIYGVADINKIEISNVDITFKGIKNYISDYLEFWLYE